MEVSEIFLYKSLGEYIYNILIYRAVLQNNGLVMHQIPDVVHVYLNMFGHLLGNWICGDLNSALIVTKYDCGKSTTNLKF